MGSISHHIMPLVINSLGRGHTNTHTHTRKHICIQTFVDRSNSKKPGAPGLKIWTTDISKLVQPSTPGGMGDIWSKEYTVP